MPYSPSTRASPDSSRPVPGATTLADIALESAARPSIDVTTTSTAGIQTSLLLTDSDVLSVAVLHAVAAGRPQTTERACNMQYTRVEIQFFRELVVTLSEEDPHLSVIMDYPLMPRLESQKAKIRDKVPEHFLTTYY